MNLSRIEEVSGNGDFQRMVISDQYPMDLLWPYLQQSGIGDGNGLNFQRVEVAQKAYECILSQVDLTSLNKRLLDCHQAEDGRTGAFHVLLDDDAASLVVGYRSRVCLQTDLPRVGEGQVHSDAPLLPFRLLIHPADKLIASLLLVRRKVAQIVIYRTHRPN